MLCSLDECGVLQRPALPGAVVVVYYNQDGSTVPTPRRAFRGAACYSAP
jgi:hypothetical protein